MNEVHFSETRMEQQLDPLAGAACAQFDWDELAIRMGEADGTAMDDTAQLADILRGMFDWVMAGVPMNVETPHIIGGRVLALCGLFGHLPEEHQALRSIGYRKPSGHRTSIPSRIRADASKAKAEGKAATPTPCPGVFFSKSASAGPATLPGRRAFLEKNTCHSPK